MDYVSIEFYLFLAAVVVLYYIFPLRFRWLVLLAGSLGYYCLATSSGRECLIFFGIIVVSWALGLLQERLAVPSALSYCNIVSEIPRPQSGWDSAPRRGISKFRNNCPRIVRRRRVRNVSEGVRRCVLTLSIALVLLPLLLTRFPGSLYSVESLLGVGHTGVVVSIGLSFFTMQIIAYLVDIYRGRIAAQRNPLKYALFVSFFPQILQGPIPRYEQLEPQLIAGHRFDERNFANGFLRILWGFFLKLVIADKAGVVVNVIFAEPEIYSGAYILVGGILYTIQLYADFLACFTLAQGAAELFGIRLADNFRRPFLSVSIREFWTRWHISLSSWLRDYVYIPLGGNRKGKLRRYINLIFTFAVSGLWHGSGLKYLFWGLMNAVYEIVGEMTQTLRDRLMARIGIAPGSRKRLWIRRAATYTLIVISWIVFRADTLGSAFAMLRSMVTVYNPWILWDDSLLELGLVWKEWLVLAGAVLLLLAVSLRQERDGQTSIRSRILAQPFWIRCLLYTAAFAGIVIFGTYGYGFNASDFIYGGF